MTQVLIDFKFYPSNQIYSFSPIVIIIFKKFNNNNNNTHISWVWYPLPSPSSWDSAVPHPSSWGMVEPDSSFLGMTSSTIPKLLESDALNLWFFFNNNIF